MQEELEDQKKYRKDQTLLMQNLQQQVKDLTKQNLNLQTILKSNSELETQNRAEHQRQLEAKNKQIAAIEFDHKEKIKNFEC